MPRPLRGGGSLSPGPGGHGAAGVGEQAARRSAGSCDTRRPPGSCRCLDVVLRSGRDRSAGCWAPPRAYAAVAGGDPHRRRQVSGRSCWRSKTCTVVTMPPWTRSAALARRREPARLLVLGDAIAPRCAPAGHPSDSPARAAPDSGSAPGGISPAPSGPGCSSGRNLFPAGPGHCPSQQAKSWELRAATSLSRFWQQRQTHGSARPARTGLRLVHRGL